MLLQISNLSASISEWHSLAEWPGILSIFLWNRYDSLTGVPVSQQNLLLEKASILFNVGALCTQIATRCNRQTQAGLESAVEAFQRAAGLCLPELLGRAGHGPVRWFGGSQLKGSCGVFPNSILYHQPTPVCKFTSGPGALALALWSWRVFSGNPLVNG